MNDPNKVVFKVWAGACPLTGTAYYRDVLNQEIFDFCGMWWDELNAQGKIDIEQLFNT